MKTAMTTTTEDVRARLLALQREYREVEASLPAHSVPASMLIRLEELEEEIDALRDLLDGEAAADESPR